MCVNRIIIDTKLHVYGNEYNRQQNISNHSNEHQKIYISGKRLINLSTNHNINRIC